MQSGSFLLIGLFSAVTLTDPRLTGWVLLAIFVLAIGLSLVFERRPFCTYFCPVGGFSGMYAQASPIEIRVIEKEICAKHEIKSCYHACPWGVYPVAFRNNTACGQCMECLRACPHDNLALNLRPHTDLGHEKITSRLDEAFLALVMLGSVLTFTTVFTGAWGWLKSAAFEIGSTAWLSYGGSYLALNLLLLPGVFSLAVWVGQKSHHTNLPFKRAIANQAQSLIPLGLTAWIAFTLSFALPKLSYILTVINDPLGWGWQLLGNPDTSRMADVTGASAVIQVALLLVGMYWSVRVSRRLSQSEDRTAYRVNIPVLGFNLLFTLVMLWLLIG
jgi:polyferredoxin